MMWIASFACYVVGVANPVYGILAVVLMVATPFFVCRRLGKFRDEGRNGVISLKRGWAYAAYVFFYAAILLALAQYFYFAYMDRGYLLQSLTDLVSTPEAKQALEQYGLQQSMSENLTLMGQMRPIDYAVNVLMANIMMGIVLGLPIAAVMQRSKAKS